jgi:hypothetical protein
MQVWHDKDPFLLKGLSAEHRPKFCSPSPAMVKSPYKWTILERDVKLYIINQPTHAFHYFTLFILHIACKSKWASFSKGTQLSCLLCIGDVTCNTFEVVFPTSCGQGRDAATASLARRELLVEIRYIRDYPSSKLVLKRQSNKGYETNHSTYGSMIIVTVEFAKWWL